MKNLLPTAKIYFFALCVILLAAGFFYFSKEKADSFLSAEENEGTEAFENIQDRADYEFNMLKNPATGTIPEGVHELEIEQAAAIQRRSLLMRQMNINAYTYQGPNNLGGRTRALAYDVRFDGSANQVILAGGISGGVFKSIDNGATWTRKSPANQLYSVTSLAQDPRPGFQDTWYYSTGESIGNSTGATGAFYFGNGIYKSTDNGETWSRLANSNNGALEVFDRRQDLITKLIVDPNSGDVYFAALDGIYRSQDGGDTWSLVLFSGAGSINAGMVSDIVCTSTVPTRFYASFSGTNNASPTNMPGVWMSTSGASGSWTKIAGATAATNPTTWKANGNYGRVVLALAPSNQNILYALYDNKRVYPATEADFFKWNQDSTSWTDLSANLPDEPGGISGNDPFAVQGGYDLVVAVKPDDERVVFIGGTNIYRSTDSFSTTANYTRIGGYANPNNYTSYANSHPDIHSIAFQPTDPAVMICGNDGGIQRTTNNLAPVVSWTDIALGYRTYQYYYVTLDPRLGNTKVLGGAQDNGTTRNIGGSGVNFERVFGGDGGSVGLSSVTSSGNTYEYVSSQQGAIYRRNSTSLPDFRTDIRPTSATDNGLFVTLFKLDNDSTELIYYASDSSLYRNTSASTATTSNWTQMTGVQTAISNNVAPKTQITALTTTRGTYDPTKASLFIGTNEGKLFRLDDPANVASGTAPVNITGAGFPANAYVSSIAVNPRNDDTVLVTFSNYGVTSVFWTGNANAATPTWQNVEGMLTAPSYRSSAITLSNGTVEYFVGTSMGLYKATIDGANPGSTTWQQEGASDIGYAVVTSLAYRPADERLLVGTHGYGMWATTLTASPLPVVLSELKGTLESNTALLHWSTSFEQNSKNFEIQKSLNGVGFYTIGFVNASGNSSAKKEYAFRDAQLGDHNYYRLRMNDNDGKYQLSNTILLNYSAAVQKVTVLNNPFHDEINLRFAKQGMTATLRLMTAGGSVLAQKQIANPSGQVRWQLPVQVSAGAYILTTVVDGKTFTMKLIRQ